MVRFVYTIDDTKESYSDDQVVRVFAHERRRDRELHLIRLCAGLHRRAARDCAYFTQVLYLFRLHECL